MVRHHGLTLSSFTIRIMICLWQSPVYPDSKQLERPIYQMLHFFLSFLFLNTRLSALEILTRKEGRVNICALWGGQLCDDDLTRLIPCAQCFTVFSVGSHTFSHLPLYQLCSAYLVGCFKGTDVETLCSV